MRSHISGRTSPAAATLVAVVLALASVLPLLHAQSHARVAEADHHSVAASCDRTRTHCDHHEPADDTHPANDSCVTCERLYVALTLGGVPGEDGGTIGAMSVVAIVDHRSNRSAVIRLPREIAPRGPPAC